MGFLYRTGIEEKKKKETTNSLVARALGVAGVVKSGISRLFSPGSSSEKVVITSEVMKDPLLRDFLLENTFRSMVNIMTQVLEQSDDVSPLEEHLIPILRASLKRNNEELSTSVWKLGESVLARCAVKLIPYLKQAVKSPGLPLDDYTEIVSTICNESNGEVEHNSGNVSLQKEKLEAAELVSKPFRHDDEIVATDKNDRAVDETEHIQTEIDNTASGDNSPASGKKFQSQSQTTTSKRTTESKSDDEQSSKLEETISILAGALKDMVDDRKLPIPVDELWGFIHEMKLDEDLAGDAFVFLLDRPVQLQGLISTPVGIRKPILLKMMMPPHKGVAVLIG